MLLRLPCGPMDSAKRPSLGSVTPMHLPCSRDYLDPLRVLPVSAFSLLATVRAFTRKGTATRVQVEDCTHKFRI